ncbi:MAG: hypothetical protein JO236_20010 [Mycobacterium sp.]|nr:hypothetical protein [Mycobacterium sp.]
MTETMRDAIPNFSGRVYIAPVRAFSESYVVILFECFLTFIPALHRVLPNLGGHFSHEVVTAGCTLIKLLATAGVYECFNDAYETQKLALISHLHKVVAA